MNFSDFLNFNTFGPTVAEYGFSVVRPHSFKNLFVSSVSSELPENMLWAFNILSELFVLCREPLHMLLL